MATKIPYVDEVWNPVVGCTKGPSKCSPGCLNCYAERMARRLACMGIEKYQAVTGYINEWTHWLGNVYCDEKAINKPLHWRKPRRILCCSMGDLFHKDVPFEFIEKVMMTIEECPQHTFYILTKRPPVMAEYFNGLGKRYELSNCPNLWLGVTICNQEEADEKIPILLSIPAAHHWISFEPLLGPIDAKLWRPQMEKLAAIAACRPESHIENPTPKINRAIIGCESGPGRRECKREWIVDLVNQCKAAGVKYMVKQMEIDGKVCHDLDKIKAELGD